jgi:hypothetical protein
MSVRTRDPAALRAQPKRTGRDFWPTPRCLTRALIEHVLPGLPRAPIWECAAGDGRVAESMRAVGYSVFASDIEPRGEGIERRDFLRDEPPHFGLIAVTNSPFGKHLTLFITRGLRLLDQGHIEGLVLLVRHDALMAQERVDAFNRAASVLHCNWRAVWIEGSRGNPRWTCSWLTWLPSHSGPTAVRWLLPEQKRRQATLPFDPFVRPTTHQEQHGAAR